MTQEQLQRANAIEEKINSLQNYRREVKKRLEQGGDTEMSISGNAWSSYKLRPELLPISTPDFMGLHLSKIERAIEELSTDLENV